MLITGFPGFDRTAQAASDLRARLAEQTFQAGGGKRSDSYVGLGADARRAVDLRAELGRRDGLMRMAERGEARAAHTQVVLKRLAAIATETSGRANGLIGMNPDAAPLVAQSARAALKEVVGLLGETFEGEAIFGGDDIGRSPVVKPAEVEDTGLYRQIRALVQSLDATNGAAVVADTLAVAKADPVDGTTGTRLFSQYATDAQAAAEAGTPIEGRRSVAIDEGVTVEVGLFANRNAAAVSRGDATSGSWSRDIIRGLAILANLTPDQSRQGESFTTLVNGAVGALRAGLAGVTEEAGALGAAEERLANSRKRHEEVSNQVEIQLGKIEQVDLAEAITRAQSTRGLLEASYRSLAMLGDLSLTKFLR